MVLQGEPTCKQLNYHVFTEGYFDLFILYFEAYQFTYIYILYAYYNNQSGFSYILLKIIFFECIVIISWIKKVQIIDSAISVH